MGIEYYGKEYSPAHFTRGVRGFYIRVLARFSAWLRRHIEWNVMHYLLNHAETDQAQREEYVRAFKAETVNMQFKGILSDLGLSDGKIVSRYSPGRKTSIRDQPLDGTYREKREMRSAKTFFERYGIVGRSKRYAFSRSSRMANPNGDVAE